jgi:hypothetical protein
VESKTPKPRIISLNIINNNEEHKLPTLLFPHSIDSRRLGKFAPLTVQTQAIPLHDKKIIKDTALLDSTSTTYTNQEVFELRKKYRRKKELERRMRAAQRDRDMK